MTSSSKETRGTFQKHLSLTQVKRMKSQTELEKKSQRDQESLSPSSSLLQPQTPNSVKQLKPSPNQSRLYKSGISTSKTPTKANPSSSPQPSSTMIKRKLTRSQTTVTSPSLYSDHSTSSTVQQPLRKQQRRKTQILDLNIEKALISPKPVHLTQNLSKNYKIHANPSNDSQKFQDFADQVKITSEETEKFDKEKTKREEILKTMKKSSGNSSFSYHSFGFNDMQQDLLAELTRSVKELNMRLIQSEEITFERLKENVELKNKLKALEGRIEEQKSFKLEDKGLHTRCSGGCQVF